MRSMELQQRLTLCQLAVQQSAEVECICIGVQAKADHLGGISRRSYTR